MKNNIAEGAFLSLFGSAMLLIIIPLGVGGYSEYQMLAMSPSFWPKLLSSLIVFLGVVMLVSGFLLKEEKTCRPSSVKSKEILKNLFGKNHRGTLAFSFLPLYYISMMYFGVVVPSALAFFVYALLHTTRNSASSFLWGCLVVLCVTVFFTKGANVLIPLGPLAFLGF